MLIFSKTKKNLPVAAYYKFKKGIKKRIDISPEKEFLQIGLINLIDRKELVPHKHLRNLRKTNITQEAWVLIKGSIISNIYDLDNKLLKKLKLEFGDILVLFRGGHSFKRIKKNKIIYEIKNGPYLGSKKDQLKI